MSGPTGGGKGRRIGGEGSSERLDAGSGHLRNETRWNTSERSPSLSEGLLPDIQQALGLRLGYVWANVTKVYVQWLRRHPYM